MHIMHAASVTGKRCVHASDHKQQRAYCRREPAGSAELKQGCTVGVGWLAVDKWGERCARKMCYSLVQRALGRLHCFII